MGKSGVIFQVMGLLIGFIYSIAFIIQILLVVNFQTLDKLIDKISENFKTLFVQSGDLGSFRNINAGLDCAFWDLFAKNQKLPLNKLLNPDSKNHISVYASGINPSASHEQIAVAKSMGIKAFKVKIGFQSLTRYGFIRVFR